MSAGGCHSSAVRDTKFHQTIVEAAIARGWRFVRSPALIPPGYPSARDSAIAERAPSFGWSGFADAIHVRALDEMA
jgi:hypothetical protein